MIPGEPLAFEWKPAPSVEHAESILALAVARSGCKEPPPNQLVQRTEVIFPPGSPRRALSPARASALSDWLFSLVLPRSFPPPSDPPLLIPASLPLSLHRRCGCRGLAPRRLLDYLQPQLAGLATQCLDLLLLHLDLVLLLTLTHVCHAVLQR